MNINIINNFFKLDKKIIGYDKSSVIELWFCLRYNIFFHHLTSDLIREEYKTTSKKKTFLLILNNFIFQFFQTLKILFFLFKKNKILEIDVGRYKIYENQKESTISYITKKNKINSQVISLSYNSKILDNKINIILIVKIVHWFLNIIEFFKKKNIDLHLIEKNFYLFFKNKNKKKINFYDIYKSIYLRQVAIYIVINFFIRLYNSEKILYLENPILNKLIIHCGKTSIKTFDIQHAMISKLSILYNFYVNRKYKYIFTKNIIIWGSYWKKLYSMSNRCLNFGYYESNKEYNIKKKKQIFIIGSGYERKYLVELLKFLSTNLKNYNIIYKLRPEEHLTEFKKYINFDEKNITFYEKIPEDDLKKKIAESMYVIGTNSTLLVESLGLSNVIVYKKGWYKDLEDLIDKKYLLSGKNCKEIFNLIKNKKFACNHVNRNFFFKKPKKKHLKKILEK